MLGVQDRTREILGIPRETLDAAEAFVREICNDSIEPPLVAHIEKILLPNPFGAELVLTIWAAKPRAQ